MKRFCAIIRLLRNLTVRVMNQVRTLLLESAIPIYGPNGTGSCETL
jgi:hypothetical protein